MFKKLLLMSSVAIIGLSSTALAGHHEGHDKKADKSHSYAKEKADIVGIATSDDSFSTLVAALKAADLVSALQADGPFTVFAPTNEAFEALPAGVLEDLLKPENKGDLAKILTYHVVPSKIMAGDIQSGVNAVATLQGQSINVEKNDAGVKVNGANVVKADVKASNGVVHVIDAVIIPE